MLATAVVVAYGLHTGFERSAARADLPDVIARFDEQPLEPRRVAHRALPDSPRPSFRLEVTNISIAGASAHRSSHASVEVIGPGRPRFRDPRRAPPRRSLRAKS